MIIRIGKDQGFELEELEEPEKDRISLDTGGQLTTLWGTVVAGIKVDKGFFVVTSDGEDLSLQWGETTVFTTEGIESLEALTDAVGGMVDIFQNRPEG